MSSSSDNLKEEMFIQLVKQISS